MSKKDPIENTLRLCIRSDAEVTVKEIEKYLRATYPLSRFIVEGYLPCPFKTACKHQIFSDIIRCKLKTCIREIDSNRSAINGIGGREG
jgi:hypothetical protein